MSSFTRWVVVLLTLPLLSSYTRSSAANQSVSVQPYAETRHDLFSFIEAPVRLEWRRCELKRVARAGAVDRPQSAIQLSPAGAGRDDEAVFVSAPQKSVHPFRDALISWNVAAPEGTGFCVELRVAADKGEWSEWMFVGDWGTVPELEKRTSCTGGKIDEDFFRGEMSFARAQIRVRAFATAKDRVVVVDRVTLCFSDRDARVPQPMDSLADQSAPNGGASAEPWKRRIAVPFRSQKVEKPEIAGRICSPTSLSMVLAFRGVDRPTSDVCARAYDAINKIYGNWPENIQAAYSYGVPGYLTRFTRWKDVENAIASGQPLIVSIAAKEGQLTGAPYKKTDGHLLVLTGFDANGDCCVNDPAAIDAEHGVCVYKRAEMQTVWLDRGGTTYVLLAKP
jgi:hypothetical protein